MLTYGSYDGEQRLRKSGVIKAKVYKRKAHFHEYLYMLNEQKITTTSMPTPYRVRACFWVREDNEPVAAVAGAG